MRVHRESFVCQGSNGTGVRVGEGASIDKGVILGYPPPADKDCPLFLTIGKDAIIRHGTVIYAGTIIGSGLVTGHNVVIREQNLIGDNFRIWPNSVIDYGCKIGNNVKIHCNVYVTQYTVLEDDVFLGPNVTLANDLHPGCPDALKCMEGPTIKKGAQIGISSCVLPRVVIGEYAVIGAGSVVTRDIPARAVAHGNPARVVGMIEDLICSTGLRDKPYSHLTERCEHANTIR